MKAVIYFSMSKKKICRSIASEIDGDHFEIVNLHRQIKFVPFQMFYYGFKTVAKKTVKFETPVIDFDKYDEVVLVSPVWAGKVNCFMSEYLSHNKFKNKTVTIIGSSLGENKNYFESFDGLIDESNKIEKHITYIKGIKSDERMV